MSQPFEDRSPRVAVIPATSAQMPILANLIELYAHDFSEFHPLDIGPDGRFGYSSLPLYWSEPGRHPFLVRMDDKLAGLVLVKKGAAVSLSGSVWDMAEFFILRGCRRQGIGMRVAHEVWNRFPGRWEIRVMEANVTGKKFWANAVAAFAGQAIQPIQIDRGGESWVVFTFESSRVE